LVKTTILLGGNLGKVPETFELALIELQELGHIVKKSSVYCSKAWGMGADTPDFYNQAVLLQTDLTPVDLLYGLLEVEKKFGRKRKDVSNYESRLLDLDIIFYENQVLDSEDLKIPHPRMHIRSFTLVPLAEIIPEFVHPILNETIEQLLNKQADAEQVVPC